jgi:hypothetical protein
MTMGQTGMGDMGEMGMRVPPNSIPMLGGQGPYDPITMGGMFTILKVRDELPADGSDPGWYQSPPDTLASPAADEDLRRDGIALVAKTAQLEARRGKRLELCDPAALASDAKLVVKSPTARVKVAMR